MTFYLKQKPKLVEPLIKKKIYKIIQDRKPKNNNIVCELVKIYDVIKLFYINYLEKYIIIIIIILIISSVLYYRYNHKKKEEKIINNIDIIPEDLINEAHLF